MPRGPRCVRFLHKLASFPHQLQLLWMNIQGTCEPCPLCELGEWRQECGGQSPGYCGPCQRWEEQEQQNIFCRDFSSSFTIASQYFTGVPKRSIEPTAEGVRIRENVCHAKNVPRASLSPIAATWQRFTCVFVCVCVRVFFFLWQYLYRWHCVVISLVLLHSFLHFCQFTLLSRSCQEENTWQETPPLFAHPHPKAVVWVSCVHTHIWQLCTSDRKRICMCECIRLHLLSR